MSRAIFSISRCNTSSIRIYLQFEFFDINGKEKIFFLTIKRGCNIEKSEPISLDIRKNLKNETPRIGILRCFAVEETCSPIKKKKTPRVDNSWWSDYKGRTRKIQTRMMDFSIVHTNYNDREGENFPSKFSKYGSTIPVHFRLNG